MPARHIEIGESAHDLEKQALRFLVDGLGPNYTVYSNAWIVQRNGAIYELDAVVVAPQAIYVVEIKGHRGQVVGNDHDWYVPSPIRSPIKLNRKTAQILKSELRRESYDAGRVWVEGFVFLSETENVQVEGPASDDRIHTRSTIIDALQDRTGFIRRVTGGHGRAVDGHTGDTLHRLLTGVDRQKPPPRKIREYRIEAALEQNDRFIEYLARHELSGQQHVLRFYRPPQGADKERRAQFHKRWRWEAGVLARVGKHDHIIGAGTPFEEEEGICLPLEFFEGISLSSWVQRHLHGKQRVDLAARIGLWRKIAQAMAYVHKQGIVHRQLRADVVLVQDTIDDPDLRIVGFDVAKQLNVNTTVALSRLQNDRLQFAAPEVLQQFSDAEPRSDQFSLGALLGLLVTGEAPFGATVELMRRGGLVTPLHELDPLVPHRLDAAAQKMLSLKAADRYETMALAIAAVDAAVDDRGGQSRLPPAVAVVDPEALEPGQMIGSDYRIERKLGQGGLSVVYAARHLASGESRALKVARPNDDAESALRGEHRALSRLSHPAIVRTFDITQMIRDRLTLVLEHLPGVTLSRWLVDNTVPKATDLRRFAEDLLGALGHLEEVDCTHKDIKPDNLLVGADGLHVIDFSLAGIDPDQTLVGTALYRDPTMQRWTHAADRYAATICLHELFSGRHPFGGQPPGPGDCPEIDDEEFDAPSLGDFFRRALDANPARRFQSAAAMRAALLDALGQRARKTAQREDGPALSVDPALPLSATALSAKASATLRRVGVHTQGDLLALVPAQVRGLRGLGSKRASEVLRFRDELLEAGADAGVRDGSASGDALAPTLMGVADDLVRLGLNDKLTGVLQAAGYVTVGRLSGATRADITRLEGVSAAHVAAMDTALQRMAQRDLLTAGKTLAQLWTDATEQVDDRGRQVLEALFAFDGTQPTQTALAQQLNLRQGEVSRAMGKALDTLDLRPLADVIDTMHALLEVQGGIVMLTTVVGRVADIAPIEAPTFAAGVLRVIAKLHGPSMCLVRPTEGSGEALCLPTFDKAALDRFLAEAYELAQWPPADAAAAESSLAALLPDYRLNVRSLARQLAPGLRMTSSGELFLAPVRPEDAIPFVLRRERPPIALAELESRVAAVFDGAANWPEPAAIAEVFSQIDEWRLDGDLVVARERGAVDAPKLVDDALPDELLQENKRPEQVVLERLRDATHSSSFRLVVTPPEHHMQVGRGLAAALGNGAAFVSFEERFFESIDSRWRIFERAERYAAQRRKLNRQANEVFEAILGAVKPGSVNVLGDTGLWELCDTLDLVRRMYDETLSGEHGFWVLAIPGTIHERQPRFNGGKTPVFHMPGAVLPLREFALASPLGCA